MMTHRALLWTIACLLISNTLMAAETEKWKTVDGWDIAVDRTVGNGCYISTIFDKGTILRIGFLKDTGGAYIGVGNANWKSIERGKEYEIVIQMDSEPGWRADATAAVFGSIPSLVAKTDKPEFIAELAKKHGMSISYNKKVIAKLSLSGSYAAIQEMVACQVAIDDYTRSNNTAQTLDPFAGGNDSRFVKDPFAD